MQDRKSIEEVIQFAAAERLLLLVDEVGFNSVADSFLLAQTFINFLFLLHSRCTRRACMDRAESLFPIKKSCLRWAKSTQRQWRWFPSTLYPAPASESEFCILYFNSNLCFLIGINKEITLYLLYVPSRCGLRAGYMEVVNMDPEVMHYVETLLCTNICTPVTGQLALDLMANPPKPGDSSYDTYTQVTHPQSVFGQ